MMRFIVTAFALVALSTSAAQAQIGSSCQVFYDKAAFDDYCLSHGKVTKGVETFEEATIQPGGKNCFPGPIGPFPSPNFPNGLEQTNLIIQANITPGPAPSFPNPSSDPCELYVIGGGFLGANSVKVGEDLFLNGIHASVDLIFTEPNHTGIGFDLSRFDGFPNGGWTIAYYDLGGVLLGTANVPAPVANEPAKSFFGVWCQQQIGRINVFDQAGPAPDAIDNIEMWVDVFSPCTLFNDRVAFEEYCAGHGKVTKGIETFEEATIQPGGKNCFPGPIGPFPSPNFPNGLDQTNLIIQDNISPGPAPVGLHPSNDPCALYVIGAGFIGANSTKIGEDLFLNNIPASVDLIFTEPNHTGIGFELSRFSGFPNGGWTIAYYDLSGALIGTANVPAPIANEPAKSFFGVWCVQQIGRINIFDQAGIAPDAIDDVEMWVDVITPAQPSSWGHVKAVYR